MPDGSEWSGVKWRGDDAGDGLGPGTLSLTLDPASKRVEGSLEGPLGAARIVGVYSGGAVTATLRRKNPTDRGFTGTLVGDVAADKPNALSGTMRVSLGDGRLIREAPFTLAKAP